MANRYALRMELAESWTVFDVFTGQPVELRHQVMVGMNARDAEAMVDQLNSRDAKRRAKADRKPLHCAPRPASSRAWVGLRLVRWP